MPVSLFVAPPLGAQSPIRLLDPEQTEAAQRRNVLYKKLPADFMIRSYQRVDSVGACDFVILPQSMRVPTPAWRAYFDRLKHEADRYQKKVVVFMGRDDAHRYHVPDAIVFKGSDYRHAIWDNEVIYAPFTEDLGAAHGWAPRKKGAKPVVSFCGYAGFPSWKARAKYCVKNAVLDAARLIGHPEWQVYKRGIYFRRAALAALRDDTRIETQFIVRNSFSGNRGTTERGVDVRAEYIDNMRQSDFVLAPKGDANFSSRFYEALSLGRIPILIDTDMLLPLEGMIDYSRFIVRVAHTNIPRLASIIADFYAGLSDEEWIAMQERARETYLRYLRYDAYFNTALPLLKERGVAALR